MFFRRKRNKKVFVGLSGGVDSSVSAAILKSKGYDVTGVFIKVWQPDFIKCTWEEDRRDAMRVCAILNIPFITLDLEDEYKRDVVDYMINEYKSGRTPNPDVMCNKYIKFGAFLKKSLSMGADLVATGHYAQNVYDKKTNKYKLIKGNDENKDQTYFLWTLNQDQLKHILFPVGKFNKKKVRKLAKKFKLPTATKKDSQGLCFIGKVDMKDFLKHFIKTKSGSVVNIDGDIIGEHEGALLYTIGQRHGFNINTKETDSLPHYVISKDLENNILIVSDKPEVSENNPKKMEIIDINNVSGEAIKEGEYHTRFRYRQELRKCNVKINEGRIFVEFENPQKAVSKGQSIVLYNGNECIGGGIIN